MEGVGDIRIIPGRLHGLAQPSGERLARRPARCVQPRPRSGGHGRRDRLRGRRLAPAGVKTRRSATRATGAEAQEPEVRRFLPGQSHVPTNGYATPQGQRPAGRFSLPACGRRRRPAYHTRVKAKVGGLSGVFGLAPQVEARDAHVAQVRPQPVQEPRAVGVAARSARRMGTVTYRARVTGAAGRISSIRRGGARRACSARQSGR